MKKYLISVFIVIFCSILIGCEKNKFDRKKAINQYAWNVGNMYVPVSQNIKYQKTTMKRHNGDYFISEIEANKNGQIISFHQIQSNGDEAKLIIDYDNMLFSYSAPGYDIKGCDFSLSKDNIVPNLKCADATSGSSFNDDKTIKSFTLASLNTIIDVYIWENDLLSRMSSTNSVSPYGYEEYFRYDDQGRLAKVEVSVVGKRGYKITYGEITFIEYNDHGDWIKANYPFEDDNYLITREISYW